MDFRSLQHIQDSAIHSSRAFQARYGPRSGFGYPLRGFRPPNPGRLFFTPAALVGFALRSFLLRRGGDAFPRHRTRVPFLPPVSHLRRNEGPARRAAASGLSPSTGVPRAVRAINTHSAGCSRGLFPFRACGINPGRASPAASHALRPRLASMPPTGASEFRELSPGPDRTRF